MKPYFGMPTWPGYYAWKLLQEAGVMSPPVPTEPLAEHLHLKVRHFCASQHFGLPEEDEEADPSPPNPPAGAPLFDDRPYWRQNTIAQGRHRSRVIDGVLRRESHTVWLDVEKPITRQRLTFGHECAHELMPGHQGLSYLDSGCLVDPTRTNRYEQEATAFGVHLLMPAPWFFEDAHSVELGLNAVHLLAHHYLTSLEATAIQYVRLNLHPCALVMAEPNPEFPESSWDFPLLVRYSVRNRAFQDFIRPGTPLPRGTPLALTSLSQVPSADRVSGWALGLRVDRRYLVECWPWGKEGDVMVLVWQIPEGNQGRLFSLSSYVFGACGYKSRLAPLPVPAPRTLVGVQA